MIWLLKDFDLVSVLMRAASLSLEALALGGLLFLLIAALPVGVAEQTVSRARTLVAYFALAFSLAQAASVALSVAILVSGSGFAMRSLMSAGFFVAGGAAILGAVALATLMRAASRASTYYAIVPAAVLLAASVAQSHAASRLDDRPLLILLTALHHLGTAGWIGCMAFLLLALRRSTTLTEAQQLARRYSAIALVSVPMLVLAGIGMSWFYIGSWAGLYGTSYGVLVLAKAALVLMMLLLGSANYRLVRADAEDAAGIQGLPAQGFLVRLRRFSEAEIGLGLTAVLAAASLTAQPPAIDLPNDRLSMHEITARLAWKTPRLSSPSFAQLVPPGSMESSLEASQYGAGSVSDAMDRAWSEYNHHWAGVIVLLAGLLAFAAGALPPGRLRRIAANWPLLFLGLAVFILLRADPENWPLGPRSFWESFSQPDVLLHRVFAVLIACFAFSEWAVATGRWNSRRAAYVFPLLCAAGGAALLTHSHGMGNIKDEMLAELAHTSIAVFGVAAGWGRWLQVRLPGTRTARVAGFVWPLCLVIVALLLLDYRES